MRRPGSLRFGALAVALLFVLSLLSGCAILADPTTFGSTPTFTTPIEWNDDDGIDDGSSNMTFVDGNRALLAKFPVGTTVHSKSGTCFRGLDQPRYTGPATWSIVDGYDLSVKFGRWTVPLESGHSLVGQQDWTELRVIDCKGNEVQLWGLVCGNAGPEPATASHRRCKRN